MEQEQRSQNAGNNAQRKDQQAKVSLIWTLNSTATAIWIFLLGVFLLSIFLPDYVPDRTDRAKVFIESMFSLAIVVVIVVHAMMYYKQAQEANHQAEIMGHALRIQTQPYVCVHSITLDHSQATIYIEVENIGTVPADSIQMDLWFKLEAPPDLKLTHQEMLKWGRKTELYRGNLRLSSRFQLEKWLDINRFSLITMGKPFLPSRA